MDNFVPELPTGTGSITPSLLPDAPIEPGIPFTPDDTTEVNSPYTGILPPKVEDTSAEDALIKEWEAAEAAERKRREDAAFNEFMRVDGQRLLDQGYQKENLISSVIWGQVVQKAQKEEFDRNYGWLEGGEFPPWEKFKEINYGENWNNLEAKQQKEAFDYWADRSAEYWIRYGQVPREEFQSAFKTAIDGHLAPQLDSFTTKQVKEDADWLDANLPATFSIFDEGVVDEEKNRKDAKVMGTFGKALDAKLASLLGDKANKEMRELLAAKSFIANYGGIDENGKVTKESLERARNQITAEYREEISDPDMTDLDRARAEQRFAEESRQLEKLLSIQDVEGEITKYNEAYHRFQRIRQNLILLQSPVVKSIVLEQDPKKYWPGVASHPIETMKFYGGEAVAQVAEMAPELTAGSVVASQSGKASTAVVGISSGFASAGQEINAIIPELMQEEMERRGLNPTTPEAWAKLMEDETFFNDVVSQATRKGVVTGVTEGALNAIFSHAIKFIPKKLPFGTGYFGRGIAGLVAGSTAAGSGEIAGQLAQRPGEPVRWIDVSQEIVGGFPGQLQQSAMERMADAYNRYTKPKDQAAAQPAEEQDEEISLESLERELQQTTQASPQTPQESSPQGDAAPRTEEAPSGQDVAGQIERATGVVSEEPVRPAQDSAEFFASLPEPKSDFASAQAILDSPNATVLTPDEANQAALLEQLSPEERETLSNLRLAKLAVRQQAQQAIKEDENYRQNLIKATRDIGNETSPIETSRGRGMSVEESNRRNQGGFVDLEAIFQGVHEFAVDTWANAKDFGSWAIELTKKYGNQILPYTERLWNSIASAVIWAKDFFTFSEKAKTRGSVDLRQSQIQQAKPYSAGSFNYGLSQYDPATNKIGRFPIAKSGIIPEREFLAVNREPLALKQDELEFLKTIVPEAFADGNVNVPVLYKGIQEKGPVVQVITYGAIDQNKTFDKWFEANYPDFRKRYSEILTKHSNLSHRFDSLPRNEQSAYRDIISSRDFIFVDDQIESLKERLQDRYFTPDKIGFFLNFHKAALELQEASGLLNNYIREYEKTTGLIAADLNPSEAYDDISAFDTRKYPVSRIDVILPQSKRKFAPDKIHEQVTNTMGWAMVQEVPHPITGKPTWFINELQSRWQQGLRKNDESLFDKYKSFIGKPINDLYEKLVVIEERFDSKHFDNVFGVQEDSSYSGVLTEKNLVDLIKAKALDNPDRLILDAHQPIVLKAVINEAKKRGIDSIVISDAETAMMTEQHDQFAPRSYEFNEQELKDRFNFLPKGMQIDIEDLSMKGRLATIVDEDYNPVAFVYPKQGEIEVSVSPKYSIKEDFFTLLEQNGFVGREGPLNTGDKYDFFTSNFPIKQVQQRPEQEGGMRVAYDVKLPSEAKRITGRVGIPVDFGRHKNIKDLFDSDGTSLGIGFFDDAGNVVAGGSNIFKNPDGTPKANITGRSYDLTEIGPKSELIFAADPFGVRLVIESVKTAFQVAKDIGEFGARIIKELGQWIKPYVQKLWDTMSQAPDTIEDVVTQIANEAAPKVTGKTLAKDFRAMFSKEPSRSPLSQAANKINWTYLPYTERRRLMQLATDYFKAKKGKGPIVKANTLLAALLEAADTSYKRGFVAMKNEFPISLKDKSADDFTSLKDVNGYIASLNNAESSKIAARHKARIKQAETRKANREKAANEAFLSAQAAVDTIAVSDAINNLSPRFKQEAIDALKVIASIDPTKLTPAEKEHITAATQNLANGSLIGLGSVLARYRASEAIALGNLASKKLKRKFLSVPLTGKIGTLVDFGSRGSLPQSFARHDTRERVAFMSPIAKQWWNKYISKFVGEGLRISHSLQLDNVKTIEAIIKKYGFSSTLGVGLAKNTHALSAKRMGIVSLLSQFRDGDPLTDLNRQLNDVINGIKTMQNDPSSVYKAIGQIEGKLLNEFLAPAVENGILIQDKDGNYAINTTPAEWTTFLFNQLSEKEQGALREIWDATSRYTKDLQFVQEFVYGKEWEPYNNYVMQQAMTVDGNEANLPDGMPLDSSTLANTDFNVPVGKTQSILNPRVGLAQGQFYNLNIFHTAVAGMNQAAYEIGTAQPRMEIKALFEDPLSNSLWDSEADKKRTYMIYKDIHQKSLGIETGTSIQGTPNQQLVAYTLIRPLQAWTALIMNSVSQLIKQAGSPLIAYILTDGAIGHFFDSMNQIYMSDKWNEKTRADFLKLAIPELLTRIETYDPAYDDLVGSGLIDEIRRISKDHSFVPLTAEQKRLKRFGYILNALDPIYSIPTSISRTVNVVPDAFAASRIFFSEYSRFLVKIGLIKDVSEFTPDLPFHKDAALHADQVVTEILGGASSREKRPNVLSYTKSFGSAGRIPALAARGLLLNLMGIQMQLSSDTFRSLGEAFYNDKNDPKGSEQVRNQARLRIRRNVIQTATFTALGYLTAQAIQNTLLFGVASLGGLAELEGLDEEEKEILRRIEIARYEAQKGLVGYNKAVQDIGMLLTGGMTANSFGSFAWDKTTSKLFAEFFQEDYETKIKELEAQRDKEKDNSIKLRIQEEIDIAKTIYNNMTYQGQYGVDFGIVDGAKDIADFFMRNSAIDHAEADRVALEYYEKTQGKKGAMEQSPEKTGPQKVTRFMIDNVLRLASTDLGTAQNRINKVRKLTMRKREEKLRMERKGVKMDDPSPEPIDPTFGALR